MKFHSKRKKTFTLWQFLTFREYTLMWMNIDKICKICFTCAWWVNGKVIPHFTPKHVKIFFSFLGVCVQLFTKLKSHTISLKSHNIDAKKVLETVIPILTETLILLSTLLEVILVIHWFYVILSHISRHILQK